MISENDVLLILHNDDWFTPSKSEKKKTVTNKDGNVLEVAESCYHNLEGCVHTSNRRRQKNTPSNNDVHPRQTIVAINPNNEVDVDGNVIKDNKSSFIDKIITETINNYLNRCFKLNEAYLGDLYHFTTLSHLYNILKHNCIYRFEDEYCHKDRRMGTDTNVVCLTRSKEFKYKTTNSVRITLDGELMSSSLRNAKIHPFRYYEDGEDNFYGVNNKSEFEERLYNSDIYPLKKYCKSIDIYVGDINKCDYYFCDDVDYAYEGLYSSGVTNPTDKQINEWFLSHIVEDFPQWLNIIHIHGINTINEVLTKKYYSRNY